MDGNSISALASGLSSAMTLTKAILGMKVDAEVKVAIADLQNSLIATQSAALESLAERDQMRKRIGELEELLEAKASWNEIRSLFRPFQTRLSLAYESDDSRYPGYYCPKCFENERLARLQEKHSKRRRHTGDCLQCGTYLVFEEGQPLQINSGIV